MGDALYNWDIAGEIDDIRRLTSAIADLRNEVEKTGAGGGIVGSIKSAVTGVKNWAGKAVTKVKNVASDAWGTVKGWFGFAEGGVVNKPTKAIIGEGSYPDAVVPLPDGRTIPVTIMGGAGGGDNSDLLAELQSLRAAIAGMTLSMDGQKVGQILVENSGNPGML